MIHIRNQSEIDKIRESCQIVVESILKAGDALKEGVTSNELDTIIEQNIRSHNAEPAFKGYQGFPASACISINEAVVHGIPDDKPIKAGSIVKIDVGVKKNGYFGDAAKSFCVGAVSEENKKLLEVTRESLYKAIEAAHWGNRLSDISYAVQSHVEKYGYSVVRQLVGHGIGTELHEEPQVPNYGKPGRGPRLKPGMVLAIEPMINIGGCEVVTADDGWTVKTADSTISAHFEHSIAIQKGSAEILTQGL
ncbi:MAG: type I methionyl aminopeptidase [Calditrichaeota bacterium]|nr:MAG: type I methionyl aminopeptidase [Calditrichota bacterium]